MERDQGFRFSYPCPYCGAWFKTVVSVEASTEADGIHLVVEEELEEVCYAPEICPVS